MDSRKWSIGYIVLFITLVLLSAGMVMLIDPYFQYHKPLAWVYYDLQSTHERKYNSGIAKKFDYDAVITGTSMAENFKTSECDEIFETNAVKVPFMGASFYEIDRNLRFAFDYHSPKIVIRTIDYSNFNYEADYLRYSNYPEYLYDENIINDVNYLLNRDTLIDLAVDIAKTISHRGGGIRSFDEYAFWGDTEKYGENEILQFMKDNQGVVGREEDDAEYDEERIKRNVMQNVVELANKYPETQFYYFLTPYSIYYWNELDQKGRIQQHIDEEEVALKCIFDRNTAGNIRLFSFNLFTDVITAPDNYCDPKHYGDWINSKILQWMKNDEGRLTKKNYQQYLDEERIFFGNYDYEELMQE